ncbi:MAG: 50S ribosomal protein L22 [Acidimicrobiia bacterium]|nr:50S ribosomal protein L22 [Acidimicrobiia bacterium]
MTGPKTNERPGTRAQAKYVRSSASKAREVLNQIRNKSYVEASEILAFSERGISRDVAKVLDSAAANAAHNDSLPIEELFVSACYADEGMTLKRARPRARGRSSPIFKRTCHITVIVSRYDEDSLEAIRERETGRGRGIAGNAAEARRRRVERSRQRKQAAEAGESAQPTESEPAESEPTVEEQAAEIVAATEQAMSSSQAATDTDDTANDTDTAGDDTNDADSGKPGERD